MEVDMKKRFFIKEVDVLDLMFSVNDEENHDCPNGAMLILKEKFGRRWIKLPLISEEAMIISLIRQGIYTMLSLITNLIKLFGIEIVRAIITEVRCGNYHGFIACRKNGLDTHINLKPFSIALVIGLKKPIYVSEDVLAECAESEPDKEEKVYRFQFEFKGKEE
jgi:bifunctional DNase/RNase